MDVPLTDPQQNQPDQLPSADPFASVLSSLNQNSQPAQPSNSAPIQQQAQPQSQPQQSPPPRPMPIVARTRSATSDAEIWLTTHLLAVNSEICALRCSGKFDLKR
jgi:hypothetical protein